MSEATYHGIVRAECLTCGLITTSRLLMEQWNDLGQHDGICVEQFVHWTMLDGSVSITEKDRDGNLVRVYKPEED